MRKLSILFACLLLTICCASKPAHAQTIKEAPPEKIVVELYLFDRYVVRDGKPKPTYKIEVPVETKSFDPPDFYPLGGGFATTGCLDCPLSSRYDFYIPETEKIDENEFKFYFSVAFENKSSCNLDSNLVVKRGKPSNLKIKCSVKAEIVAYYQTADQ